MSADAFVFAVCQRGAESALKNEAARARPDLRAGYQRPGLVTFKGPPDAAARTPAPVFARAWGASLGTAVDFDALAERLAGEPALGVGPWHLHVFERDGARPGEAPPALAVGARAAGVEQALRERLRETFRPAGFPAPGDVVVDVVVAPDRANERDDPWLVGWHRHGAEHSPNPGGHIPVPSRPGAPSRAYRKIEEALAVSGFAPQPGQRVVELGAAPGGTAYAMLERGLHVVAVDPQEMNPAVAALAEARGLEYAHVASPMAAVRLEALPREVQWLLMDVHLAPQVALHSVTRWVGWWRKTLEGVVFTLKLGTWEDANELPTWLERMRALGLEDVHAVQLPSNRQEVCAYGRMARGRPARRGR